MKKVASFLTRYISIIILICSAFAFWKPDTIRWATNYTSVFLGIAMFGMGLTIRGADFKVIFTKPKEILVGCVAQYTVMPLVAWVLCVAFHLPADLAIGVILVGCCPGGTASNVITYIAGGDVALSVGMTIVSTLIAPIMTPVLVYFLGGAWVQVSFMDMVFSVVKVVLVPVILGLVLHHLFEKTIAKIQDVLPLVSVAAIVMIISGIVAANREKLITSGILILGIVVLHNFFGMGLGLGIAKLFKIEEKKAAAIAIEVGMQNSGLAVSLAATNFSSNPLATLAGAVFSVWHNIAGSIFAGICRAKLNRNRER